MIIVFQLKKGFFFNNIFQKDRSIKMVVNPCSRLFWQNFIFFMIKIFFLTKFWKFQKEIENLHRFFVGVLRSLTYIRQIQNLHQCCHLSVVCVTIAVCFIWLSNTVTLTVLIVIFLNVLLKQHVFWTKHQWLPNKRARLRENTQRSHRK